MKKSYVPLEVFGLFTFLLGALWLVVGFHIYLPSHREQKPAAFSAINEPYILYLLLTRLRDHCRKGVGDYRI